MKDFAKSYEFNHITSIPHYLQGNTLAERIVKISQGSATEVQRPIPCPHGLQSYTILPKSTAELLMG